MGFFDDDNDYFDDDRFFREYSGGAFGNDDDDLLTFEEQELKDAGIDLDEFELMDDEEKKEILEDNFLDPEDFRDMFDDDSILDDDDDEDDDDDDYDFHDHNDESDESDDDGYINDLKFMDSGWKASNNTAPQGTNNNFKIIRRYSQTENEKKDNSINNSSDGILPKEKENKNKKDNYKPPYKMNLTVPIIIFVIGILNIIFGAIDSNVPEKEALESMHNGHGNPNTTGPIGAVLGLIAAIVGICMIFNEIIKYTDSLPPKEKEVNNKVYDLKKENKKDLIKLAVITLALIFGISAIVHLKGKKPSDPKEVIQEFFDTYEEDYDYTVGDVENENDTYRELVNIATWYSEKYQYIESWRETDYDFFSKRNIKIYEYSGHVREEVKRRHKELDDIMVGYISELIDKSDKKFRDRKDEIIKQMKDGVDFLADARKTVNKHLYKQAFDYAIQFGDQPLNNIVVETMNALYPSQMKRGCNAYIKYAETRSTDTQLSMLSYVKSYYIGIGKVDSNLNSKIDQLTRESRKQSTSGNSNSNSSSSSSHSSGSSSSSSGKKTESTTVDPMDHDIDLYYEDYKDEFEDEDDAWDDFEDNDEYWDDY